MTVHPLQRVSLALASLAALAPTGLSHERWVKHSLLDPNFDRSLFDTFTPLNVSVLIGLFLTVVVLISVAERVRERELGLGELSSKAKDIGALILGVTYGLGAILPAFAGEYQAPDLVAEGSLGNALVLGNAVLGAMLILGLFTRLAGAGTLVLFLVALALRPFADFDSEAVSFGAVLNYVDVAGISLFFLLRGRGRYSVDHLLGRPAESKSRHIQGVISLRVLTGTTLLVLGLQKFLMPELPMGVVQNYADMIFEPINALTGCSPEQYVFGASVVECSVGALLVLGLFTRCLMLVLAGLFTTTLFVFKGELVGHLSLFGIVIALLIEGGARPMRLPRIMPGQPQAASVASSLLLVSLLLGFASCGQVEAGTLPNPTFTAAEDGLVTMPLTSEDGTIDFLVTFQAPSLGSLFSAKTEVRDSTTGQLVPGVQFELDATMPEHNHGMQTLPRSLEIQDGVFETAGMKLHMGGSWQISARVKRDKLSQSAHGRFHFTPGRPVQN